jgi:hypothetical protein
MQQYIQQLIADMRQAAVNLPAKPYYDIPPEAEGIEYVIEWENATAKPMKEWIGIAKEHFPPPDKLTDDELAVMVDEILKLWAAYNFYTDFPENLPVRIAYKVLVDFFDKPVAWVSQGNSHIEFCDYDPNNCPFPAAFCRCKDFADETDEPGGGMQTENAGEISVLDKEIKEIEVKSEDEFLPVINMQRYVEQLIVDLQTVAKNFLMPGPIPGTAEQRGAEDTRQLIENPYVTLEELTGIEAVAFPEHIDMDGLQTRKVLRAMLHLLDACNLKVYFPDEAPHEIKYEALRENWNVYGVKHLPLSGDEIELCTGDPMTCPFGEFCNCYEPSDEMELPDRFNELIPKIVDCIEAGLVCFLNPETLELEDVPQTMWEDPQEFSI